MKNENSLDGNKQNNPDPFSEIIISKSQRNTEMRVQINLAPHSSINLIDHLPYYY